MTIFREFSFDSAHFLPNVPPEHKCSNMHGHTYKLKVFVQGALTQEGWVIDFKELKEIIYPVVDILDHHVLNDIPGLENPTCEIVTLWLWQQLKNKLPGLKRIELNETASSGAVYEGDS